MKLLNAPVLGYECFFCSCDETCTTCCRLIYDTVDIALENDSEKLIATIKIPFDNGVKIHEVYAHRLFKIDLSDEPF